MIAVDVGRPEAADSVLARPAWPKRFQLVPISRSQKRSGGWTGILSPEGGTWHFRTGYGDAIGYFAPYLNSHVCFARRDGGWKITAIAYRLD